MAPWNKCRLRLLCRERPLTDRHGAGCGSMGGTAAPWFRWAYRNERTGQGGPATTEPPRGAQRRYFQNAAGKAALP